MPVATLVDVTGTQAYIFASNRLRDAVVGSALVAKVTPGLTSEGVPESGSWLANKAIIGPGEVIISGGGAASLRFSNVPDAKAFAARLSRRILDEAPGLSVVIAHKEYQEGSLASTLVRLAAQMERAKLSRQPGVPLLGLGVTAECTETGLPAIAQDIERRPISASIATRRNPQKQAEYDARWQPFLNSGVAVLPPSVSSSGFELAFPFELDDLGRTLNERSLIGIVHIDGNGIGEKCSTWIWDQAEAEISDDAFITAYRALSMSIAGKFADALKGVVKRVCRNVDNTDSELQVFASLHDRPGLTLGNIKEGPKGSVANNGLVG